MACDAGLDLIMVILCAIHFYEVYFVIKCLAIQAQLRFSGQRKLDLTVPSKY